MTIESWHWEAIADDSRIREYQESPLRYEPAQVLEFPLKEGGVNILFGLRQTGKSTALKLLIRKLLEGETPPQYILYYNCDALGSARN